MTPAHSIVLFDGVCNLCNGAVLFIIDRDPRDRFRFAPLQSAFAQELLRQHGISAPVNEPESIVLVEDGKIYERSTAALRIARHLAGPVKLLWCSIVVPRPIRDAIYRWIARNRYQWFGRTEACRVPTPALRERFLA